MHVKHFVAQKQNLFLRETVQFYPILRLFLMKTFTSNKHGLLMRNWNFFITHTGKLNFILSNHSQSSPSEVLHGDSTSFFYIYHQRHKFIGLIGELWLVQGSSVLYMYSPESVPDAVPAPTALATTLWSNISQWECCGCTSAKNHVWIQACIEIFLEITFSHQKTQFRCRKFMGFREWVKAEQPFLTDFAEFW